jgi:hypothetical protein
MKNLRSFVEFVNESVINESTFQKSQKLLQDMFKEAKKSKNFSDVKMMPSAEFSNDAIYIKSKLKSESDYHKNEYDEFEIGIDDNTYEVIAVYIPSGYDEELTSIEDFKKFTRA